MMRLILSLTMWVGLVSCATLSGIEEPTASVTKVDITDPSLTDALLVFSVRVANPNSFPLKVNRITYDLKLNEENFLAGELEKGIEIAANADSVLEIPLRIKYTEVLGGVSQITKAPATKYNFEGRLYSSFWSVPIKKTGEFRLSDALAFFQ